MMRGALAALAWDQPMASLADPPGTSALLGAALWAQNLVVGPVATMVAVIAVATVGLMMLSGRLDLRRGGVVLCGCFVLFGALSIATGLREAATAGGLGPAVPVSQAQMVDMDQQLPIPAPPTPLTDRGDPYAGASVPQR